MPPLLEARQDAIECALTRFMRLGLAEHVGPLVEELAQFFDSLIVPNGFAGRPFFPGRIGLAVASSYR